MNHYNKHLFVCTNQKTADKKCCAQGGGEGAFDYLKTQLLELSLWGPEKIRVTKSGCLGRCNSGPCIVIYPEGVWYRYNSLADIDKIIDNHLINNSIIEHLLIDQSE